MQIDFSYNCIVSIGCFYYSSLFFILSISIAIKSFSHSTPSRLSKSSISFNRVRRGSSVFLWLFSFAAVWDTFLFILRPVECLIQISSCLYVLTLYLLQLFLYYNYLFVTKIHFYIIYTAFFFFSVQIQQFLLDFCTHRTFSIIQLFYRSCKYHFLLIPRIKTPATFCCTYCVCTSSVLHYTYIKFRARYFHYVSTPMEIPSQDFISEFHCFFSKEFTQIFDDVTHSPQL